MYFYLKDWLQLIEHKGETTKGGHEVLVTFITKDIYKSTKEPTSCLTDIWATTNKIGIGNRSNKRRSRRETPCFGTPNLYS